MLPIKKAEELKLEDMYYELIKMRFLTTNQLTVESLEQHLIVMREELRADMKEGEEEAIEYIIGTVRSALGSAEKIKFLEESILEKIELLETALDNAEHDLIKSTDFFSIYDWLHSETLTLSAFGTATVEDFEFWYTHKYKVKSVKAYD